MKQLGLILILIACFTVGVSCEGLKPQEPKNVAELFSEIKEVAMDDAVTDLSDDMLDKIEMVIDSMTIRAKVADDYTTVVLSKSVGLQLISLLMDKGKNVKAERLQSIIDRSDDLQFGFDVDDSDNTLSCYLVNVFFPEYHEAEYGAYFDIFIFIDKTDVSRKQMSIILPDFCSDPNNKPQFNAFVSNSDDVENLKPLACDAVSYDENSKAWKATFSGSEVDLLLKYNRIILFVIDGEKIESSMVNLNDLHEKLKPAIADANSKE
ncbi:MAG: hypothetical protein MJZ73_04645 [Bacteroidaceae bacterium]|nr:hypothetical protein [Bacteroidaceae bacterium]